MITLGKDLRGLALTKKQKQAASKEVTSEKHEMWKLDRKQFRNLLARGKIDKTGKRISKYITVQD